MTWQRMLAHFRLSLAAVCAESTGFRDYHDYRDDALGKPWHFVELTCERCGKKFTI